MGPLGQVTPGLRTLVIRLFKIFRRSFAMRETRKPTQDLMMSVWGTIRPASSPPRPGSSSYPVMGADLGRAAGEAGVRDVGAVYGTAPGSWGFAGKALLVHLVQGKYCLRPPGELGSAWRVRPPSICLGISRETFGGKNEILHLSCQKETQTGRPVLNASRALSGGKQNVYQQ